MSSNFKFWTAWANDPFTSKCEEVIEADRIANGESTQELESHITDWNNLLVEAPFYDILTFS